MRWNKGQEEIVGFVVIVVLVVIIGLIFLGISLRNTDRNERSSDEIGSFLLALRPYTTSCVYQGYRQSIDELISLCKGGRVCDGGNSCEILKKELEGIMNQSSFIVSEGSAYTYYELRVYERDNSGFENDLIEPVTKSAGVGGCRGLKLYNFQIFNTQAGPIDVRLEVCRLAKS